MQRGGWGISWWRRDWGEWDNKELLDQTQTGVHCSNKTELREYLLKAYREYKELGRNNITDSRKML